jgi:MFS family permease
MFRALEARNYRLYFGGQILSNAGTWMQRVAQDWLVLDLSGGSAVALGVTTALQFLPFLLFSLWGGTLADRVSRRKLLVITQTAMGLLALLLGVLALGGLATVAIVYVLAFALGVAAAFDNPARQAFVNELVGRDDLGNAIALNSASFNLARLVGPAIAGVLVAVIGSGWVFVLNAATFVVTIWALLAMHTDELRPVRRQEGPVRLAQGMRYVRRHADLVLALTLAFVVATFGLNYQITMALMARLEYGVGAEAFGLMSSALAVGALGGSLLAARRVHVPMRLVAISALAFGVVEIVVGLAPTYVSILLVLPFAGAAAMTFTTAVQTYLQGRSESWVRGRVLGLYTLLFFGGTPIGAPIIGWASEQWGPRVGLIGGGALTFAISGIAVLVYLRHRRRPVTPDAVLTDAAASAEPTR